MVEIKKGFSFGTLDSSHRKYPSCWPSWPRMELKRVTISGLAPKSVITAATAAIKSVAKLSAIAMASLKLLTGNSYSHGSI